MIETKDLVLRQGSADDWQDLYRYLWSREEVFCFLFSKASPDEAAAKKRTAAYAQMHKEVKTEYFVYEKESGKAIGIAGIKELKPGCWTITDVAIGPDFQGKGYGKQIVSGLRDYAFLQMKAKKLSYSCFAGNVISGKLAKACGLEYAYSEEAELRKNGETVMLDYYIIGK